MRAVVVGSGAREHALALAIGRTCDVVVTPGNPGITGTTDEGHSLSSTSMGATELEADLFVIGPEAPLVDGLADELRARGRLVFGPGADGARLEGSKAFMKELAAGAGVPTAAFGVFDDPESAVAHLRSCSAPYVIKADGLAAGKGVLVTDDLDEAEADVRAKLSGSSFGEAGRRVVIEEGLSGSELSLLVLIDGKRCVPLPAAQDFKRLLEGDRGPNTGGMGAYSPVPEATEEVVKDVMTSIVEPTLEALREKGIDYRGVLYAGCMLTEDGPKLIEFNVRFGDPEAEVVLARIQGDVASLLREVAEGDLVSPVHVSSDASVCVVVASEGYPAAPVPGAVIQGVEDASTHPGVSVLHAGTRRDEAGALRVAAGRVLAVRGVGADVAAAREVAYEGLERITFQGMQMRHDIALAAARRFVGKVGR